MWEAPWEAACVHKGTPKNVEFTSTAVRRCQQITRRDQTVSASSTLPTETASLSSTSALHYQVMSEAASSSSNTGVKRSSDACSHCEPGTKRFHADHAASDVVMLLEDAQVSQAGSQCWEVSQEQGVFLADVKRLGHCIA